MYGQCSTCGDPGQGLQLQFTFPTGGVSALGFVNNTFSYDPSTQGGLASITASVDKNIITDRFGPGLGNTFRPLIEQDGTIYLAAIPGPTFTGPATTGYQTLSGTLTAASFTDYNFTTGVAGTTNPNFSGDTILFGLGQISTFPGSNSPSPTTNFEADYDNLTITTSGAPEPSTWALIIGGFGIIGFGLRRGKNKPGIDWNCACSA